MTALLPHFLPTLLPPSSRCLCVCVAQEGFRPAKYFSIDRVFRNEAIDRTHLAEFHQIEGELYLYRSWCVLYCS